MNNLPLSVVDQNIGDRGLNDHAGNFLKKLWEFLWLYLFIKDSENSDFLVLQLWEHLQCEQKTPVPPN